jgi:hypothetical protein
MSRSPVALALSVARQERKSESRSMAEPKDKEMSDPDALARALELELIQKRAEWQKARTQRGTWRAVSLLFLLLVLLGALAAFFFVLPQLRSRRTETPAAESGR